MAIANATCPDPNLDGAGLGVKTAEDGGGAEEGEGTGLPAPPATLLCSAEVVNGNCEN